MGSLSGRGDTVSQQPIFPEGGLGIALLHENLVRSFKDGAEWSSLENIIQVDFYFRGLNVSVHLNSVNKGDLRINLNCARLSKGV
jgi:hypothetical protein